MFDMVNLSYTTRARSDPLCLVLLEDESHKQVDNAPPVQAPGTQIEADRKADR